MSNLYKYLFIVTLVLSILFIILYYCKYTEYNKLNVEYIKIKSSYAVEQSNTTILRNTIQQQNLLIEQYKTNSLSLEQKIFSLNNQIKEKNKEQVEYAKIPENNSSTNNTELEDAFKWMQQKSNSLVH